ncbi:hypothetical protein HZH66_011393 [Vespula vulgaris]|uniref:Uncharacterized protein n=1 Tax=Vespula vulgaris TaxID=7454 RepID=A0A834JK67_VESVU|nr:hypothetical protein HZH66_011393 [Vespula vulgaris]
MRNKVEPCWSLENRTRKTSHDVDQSNCLHISDDCVSVLSALHVRCDTAFGNQIDAEHVNYSIFVDYLNKFSEINYLICTFAGMLIIMLDFVNIFQLATIMRHISELIECGTYIVCSLFAIYINFYIGQMLINHSQAAFTELCQVPFYMLSVETQKLLLFVIARSKKQCVLSIGASAVWEKHGGLVYKATVGKYPIFART